MIKRITKAIVFVILVVTLTAFGARALNFNLDSSANDQYGVFTSHTHNVLPVLNLPESQYMTYAFFREQVGINSATIEMIDPNTWGKIIRFDTAEELHRFSLDVSYNLTYTQFETKLTPAAIQTLLSLHYVLGNDIDYSVMKSKQFNPIGFDFYRESINYSQTFKGIFDGRGFEITNLYFSDYDDLTEILYEGTPFETTLSYTKYYSMFAYNEGTIKNFGLINPTFEFNFESETLFKAANIVGINLPSGNVNHVYVIDTRATALVAGIRMVASAGQAAGVMFENQGIFNNAYFASRVVMNASFGSRFNVQPVLYTNDVTGVISNLAFDDTLYQEVVEIGGNSFDITTPNSYAVSLTTTQLRSQNAVLGSQWYFFPAENVPTPKYPTLLGLDFVVGMHDIILSSDPNDKVTVTDYFIIENAVDLVAFSRILDFTREQGLTPFRELNYIVTNNIDLRSVSANAFQTPNVEFSGVFAGATNDIHINDLNIVDGVVQGGYFVGLFGVLSGEVYNLLFYNASLTLTQTDNYAGAATYVGLIAGQLAGGTIRNILVEVDIDLGQQTMGELYVGAIVGNASGLVSGVFAQGNIFGNNNNIFRTDIVINPEYHMGGLIGATGETQLILTDAYNSINVFGIGTQSTNISALTAPNLYLGGVIGKVENTAAVYHVLGLLTNSGELHSNELISQFNETQYIGGVIGMSAGTAHNLNYTFGNFVNSGLINVINRGTNQVYAAGVLVSDHSEQTEFIHLFNQETATFVYYTITGGVVFGDFSNLDYTTLVYNVGQGITLSQSKNDMNINLYGTTSFSGVYHSSNNSDTLLRFVENNGDITFENQTLAATTSIAGITQSENVSFLNVIYDGSIKVYNVNMFSTNSVERQLFISGFAKTLTMGESIINGAVNGQIIVAGITSNQVDRSAPNNIYIGGFVNYNNSGNMDPNGNLDTPVATIGIINSINNADIHSRISTAISGISGHANVFVGGVATFNDGDIQDVANMGDIRFENTSSVDTSNVRFNSDSRTAGAVTKYRYATILGGISAAVLSQKSRIYDSVNSGTIIGVSQNFSRTGGILGLAIWRELRYGNVITPYTSVGAANIRDSILSNCINYGDVSALTITISSYTNSNTTQRLASIPWGHALRFDITQPINVPRYQNSFYSRLSSSRAQIRTRTSTQERPGINASAGGIIGYGLSVMRRMINHGQISATDVAGGVVGATAVLGSNEYVQIDTAINYGRVRAFNRGTSGDNYANFHNIDIMNYDTIRQNFFAVDSTFIFPETRSCIRLFPENKRGFGGIFGRLQRGLGLRMYGNNDGNSTFNFIVNMDPNVDLIGRLDQVYTYMSSLRFYDFEDAVYFSARKNDTTQAVFTGVSYFYDNSSWSGSTLFARRIVTNIQMTSQKYEYSFDSNSQEWIRTTYEKTTNRSEVSLTGRRFTRYGEANQTYQNHQTEIISRSDGPAHNSTGWSQVAGSQVTVGTLSEFLFESGLPLYNQVWDVESTKISGSTSATNVPNRYYLFATALAVPVITEDPNDPQGQFVYSPTFVMQTDAVLQQYIYFAENGNLSPTFINSRPNGMYVLATSSGSVFGSILPANIKFDNLLPLALTTEGTLPKFDIDYENAPKIQATDCPSFTEMLSNYQKLFQTMYSDQSELLENNDSSLVLQEIDGSMTKLLLPVVVDPTALNPTGTITFNINLATLDFAGGDFATVNYHILDALLPKDAVIAKTIEDFYGLTHGSDTSAYTNSFRSLLEAYVTLEPGDPNRPNLTPVFSHTFDLNTVSSGVISIGHFTSYSEVSQFINAFLNETYVTDYEVLLNVTYDPGASLPFLRNYQIDGGANNTSITPHIPQEVAETLRFTFRDLDNVLPVGTNIMDLGTLNNDNVALEFFDEITQSFVVVEYEHFGIIPSLVEPAGHHRFRFTLELDETLRSGLYRVSFRLLPFQDVKDSYTFTKSKSGLSNIVSLRHYSSEVVAPVGQTINSNVNFGYVFDFNTTVTGSQGETGKPYHSSSTFYSLPFIEEIFVSDFATISNVHIGAITHTINNYRIYNITYTITAEDGISFSTYTHEIHEREIAITDVFRNNNRVTMDVNNPVQISREAISTTISLDYGIDELFAADIYNLEADNPLSHFVISPLSSPGIEVSVTNSALVFTIDSTVIAGNYQFSISYYRNGEALIDLGVLYFTKNQGRNAYLTDIKFAILATETSYPEMFVSDALGIPELGSAFNPTVFFAGIDYDGAKEAGETNFRVDGQVSNIPLDQYIPHFLSYLPLGATIARKLDDGTFTQEIAGPTDPNIAVLAADFTRENFNVHGDLIVVYRVTSEDGSSEIFYHITVTDITFNVSLIFDVIYVGNTLQPNLDGVVIAITVRNLITNLPVGDTVVTQFPAFNEIIASQNSTNLLFMLGQDNYRFRFGRNRSGFFSFDVNVLDSNGLIYDFTIEWDGVMVLQDVADFDLDTQDKGKYFYINSSLRNRTRNFTITIHNARHPDRDFGFDSEDKSWE